MGWGIPKRPKGSGGIGLVKNRKQESEEKKKEAEQAKLDKKIAKDKEKEKEKEDTAKQLKDMKTQLEDLKKAPPPQPVYAPPAQSSYSQPSYSQPSYSQPNYSQPAPPPPKKIGFWERLHDTSQVVSKYQRMNRAVKRADNGRGSTKKAVGSFINYLAEAERYKSKYS